MPMFRECEHFIRHSNGDVELDGLRRRETPRKFAVSVSLDGEIAKSVHDCSNDCSSDSNHRTFGAFGVDAGHVLCRQAS
jgi:hypothetical protein